MTSAYSINLNFNNTIPVKTDFTFKQGDKGITLNLATTGLDPAGTTAHIVFKRSNGTSVEAELTGQTGPSYSYTILGNEFEIPGVVVADLKLYNGDTQRVSTASFIFLVTGDTMDGVGGGTGGYSDQLEQLSEEFEDTLNEYKDAFGDVGAVNPRGAYDSTEDYNVLDLVSYQGSSYLCRTACKNKVPTNTTYWQVFASGGGAGLLPHVVITSITGATVTLTKGGTTITATETSTGTYEADVDEYGTWSASAVLGGGGSVTDTLSIDAVKVYTLELVIIPNGSTVTPTDDIPTWLHCGDVWTKNYTTVAEVIADSETLLTLISDNNAVDYMVRSASFRTAICADALSMLYIGQYNYCADALLADSVWRTAICDSEYFELVLTDQVPVMTSDIAPSGVASASDNDSNAYLAFDKSNSTGWQAETVAPQSITYRFPEPHKIIAFKLVPRAGGAYTYRQVKDFVIQGSNDGITFTDLYTGTIPDGAGTIQYVDGIENNSNYIYYRCYVSSTYNSVQVGIIEFELYARTDVAVPTHNLKTFATANDSEILEMVCKADRGEIDLYDDAGWRVGQEHNISFSGSWYRGENNGGAWTSGETQDAQIVTFVLMHHGLYELVNPVLDTDKQTRNICSFVVGLKDCLNTAGYMNSSNTNIGSWDSSARRFWCNYGFRAAIPATLRAAFKQFKTITATEYNSTSNTTSNDYFALAAEKEVLGTASYSRATEAAALTQFTWYEATANRVKRVNGSAADAFGRSPRDGVNTQFCCINNTGNASTAPANNSYGISPFGCL